MSNETGGRRLGGAVLGAFAFALGLILMAPVSNAEDAAQTARAVRLSSVDGQVRLVQGNQVLAESALANTPLFEGTEVATLSEGRAEIQFENGSVVRIAPDSSLTLSVLRQQGTSTETEIVLERGLAYFELQGESQNGPMRVRFDDSVVTASGFTVLRINRDNPPGELAVFSGNVHLERGSALMLDLHGGESVALNGANASLYKLAQSIEPNSWDTWNSDRDQALTAAETTRTEASSSFANNNNPAWSDLDSSGNWYNVPGQGYVWSPYEATALGWDPYGSGHWMWTPRYGYIWLSGYSWGYIPYQCGAWNYYDSFGWGWMPGMGGCRSSWWNNGFYAYNIGMTPRGYLKPGRPRLDDPRDGRAGGGRNFRPRPVISVGHAPGRIQVRDKTTPVAIDGHSVQPLSPVQSQQPRSGRVASGFVSGSRITYQGVGTEAAPVRRIYSGGAMKPSAPVMNQSAPRPYSGVNQHVSAPRAFSGGGNSGSSAPASRPSGGGMSHSGGGFSSGAAHSSMGGPAGGGSHSSGGSGPRK